MSGTGARSMRSSRAVVLTAAAAAVLFVVALAPGVIGAGSARALVRLPLEIPIALILLLVIRGRRARRAVATLVALLLVLAIIDAALDRVFAETVGHAFDPVTGWPELVSGYGVIRDSLGWIRAFVLLILVALASAWAVVAVAASLLRVAQALSARRSRGAATLVAITASWLVLALLGVQLAPGEPAAAADAVDAVVDETARQIAAANENAAFERAIATDAFAGSPGSELLTGLAGKDVVVAFIESYGRSAVEGSSFSPGVNRVLTRGEARLAAHGYASRSAFLVSPAFGGMSWLAHSTLQSGLWIDSQQKYDRVTSGSRLTLSAAFGRAGWRTVSDVPSNTRDWPVGRDFYGFDAQLNALNVGYRGPRFSYAQVPDQFTWAAFRRLELAAPHRPVMAEIDFASSHMPWTPLPSMVPWESLGDGSVYAPQPGTGIAPMTAWEDPDLVRQLYGRSIEYSLNALFSYLTAYDDPDLVLVVLGDHQPAPVVSGAGASHDVPISIIAKDPAVMNRIEGWRWQPGMRPDAAAPEWRMDRFRDRFLEAYGPRASAPAAPAD